MFTRRRGDVVFVTSEVARDARARTWPPTSPSKAGLEGFARAMAMECEGTGVRVGIVRPGPSSTEQGTTWDEDTINEVVASWYALGTAAPRRLAAPDRDGRGGGGGRLGTEGHPLRRARGRSRKHLSPRGTHDRTDHRPGRRSPATTASTGHLEELRTDPIGLMQRVRDECGDVGRFQLADKRGRAAVRGGGQRGVLPGLRRGARPGRGLPVHDADLRRGRGVRRQPRGAPAEMLHNQALRDKYMKRPRRDHRRRDRADGRRLGRRGRDRPARLLRRADHLHLDVLPDRREVPRGARRAASRSSSTTSSAAPTRIAFVDPYADIESFRRRDAARAELVELIAGDHAPTRERRTPADDEDRDLLDVLVSIKDDDGHAQFTRRRGHRHVHLDDVRRAPHHLGHRVVDADRAAAQSRRAWPRSWPRLDDLADAGGGEITYQALRQIPVAGDRRSRRRCACTRR